MNKTTKISRLEYLKSVLTEPGSKIHAAQEFAGNEVRTKTRAALGRMVDAHLLIAGVIGGMLLRTDGKRTDSGGAVHERRVLFASYVVGMPVCEQAIEEGRYLQALALLRQEMETLAQVVSSQSGKRKFGKVANVAVLRKDISRLYGTLSAAAHSSKHSMASVLLTREHESEDRVSTGTYFYPVLNAELARRAFALHLILTVDLISQMAIDYQQTHPVDGVGLLDQEAVNLALARMAEEGMVETENKRGTA